MIRELAVARIIALGELPYDWNSYGAEPISDAAIQRAITLVTDSHDLARVVMAMPYGGVGIEWESGNVSEISCEGFVLDE